MWGENFFDLAEQFVNLLIKLSKNNLEFRVKNSKFVAFTKVLRNFTWIQQRSQHYSIPHCHKIFNFNGN